ncbi:hypothetical protein Tco_0404280 [Tanacetum coccineum]
MMNEKKMMMMKALQLDQTRVSQKRRRHDSGASGSAQPPTKDDEQSLKKPRESDASASKQHPALTSTGWQITDTRDAVERPATPDPEWTILRMISRKPKITGRNTYATTSKSPGENKLQRKTYNIGSIHQMFCRQQERRSSGKADFEGSGLTSEVNANMNIIAVYVIMHTVVLKERNSTSSNTVSPLLSEASDRQMRILSVTCLDLGKGFQKSHPKDLKICSTTIFKKKLNHLPRHEKTSLHITAVNILDKKAWMQRTISSKKIIHCPKLRAIVYKDKNDKKADEAELIYTRHGDEEVSKMTRGKAKNFITAIEKKTTDQKDLSKDLESFFDIEHVAVSSSLRFLEPKRTIESRAKRSSINLVRTQHPSETMVFHNEDGNPARANIKQALGYLKDGDGDGNSQHLRYQVLGIFHLSNSILRYPVMKQIAQSFSFQSDNKFDSCRLAQVTTLELV